MRVDLSQLDSPWTSRLKDTIKSGMADYHPKSIEECARRSFDIAARVQSSAAR